MASYQKRGKTWQYTVSNYVDGKLRPIRKGGFKTKKEAQAEALKVELDLQNGLKPASKESFERYFEEWYKLYKKDRDKNTIRAYRETHTKIKEHFGDKAIQSITKRDYKIFISKLGEDRAKETIRKVNVHIRGCVQDAIDEGIIRSDFTRKVEISGSVPAKKAEEKYLNYTEGELLIQETIKRLDNGLSYYVILLGLTSGMRFSEMMGLQRSDFDFKDNLIHVNKKWGYTKNMSDGFGATKTENSKRTIKMDKVTMQIFRDLFKRTPPNIHQLVFYAPTSKYKVISNAAVNKSLKTLLKHLRIDTNLTIHGLRHTHASILIYKKVSIYYISERLGHADINTTLTYYAHLLNEMRKTDESTTITTIENMII